MAEWLSSDGRFCGGENSHFLDRIPVHNTARARNTKYGFIGMEIRPTKPVQDTTQFVEFVRVVNGPRPGRNIE